MVRRGTRACAHGARPVAQLTGARELGARARETIEPAADLPLHHRDPFDRLLIAQAQQERLVLATADPRIAAYEVAVLDPLS